MFYRITFVLAGIYNLVFGIFLFIHPDRLFRVFNLPLLLGENFSIPMSVLIAAFSAVYFYAAWKPGKSMKWIVLAVMSKIAPSIAAIVMIDRFSWPTEIFSMILFNDWIWLPPLILFLWGKQRSTARGPR